MSASVHDRAVRGLRWALGVVVLWESCLFLRATILRAYGAGHVGVHGWIFLLLASVEIVAAALFLAPELRAATYYSLSSCLPRRFTFYTENSTTWAGLRCTPQRSWFA